MSLAFEKRGVKLALFQRVRDECLSRDATPDRWTIGRVSALVIGNHEILKAGNRWEADQGGQAVDASSTLTHAGQCSLIEAIHQGRFKEHDAPLGGNLHYDDVVGDKAKVFVSFAYSCDFIELVDALERFIESTPSLDKNSTYLWFDLFVNDQWTALDKPFEWWGTTFKEAVEKIGHTVVIMLPWEAPIPLTRVWCLFEIFYSTKKLSIALSRKQTESFRAKLRSEDGTKEIQAALCKIDVEQATSHLPEDKEKIFAVIKASKDGVHGLNVDVSAKMREWILESVREISQERDAEQNQAAAEDFFTNGVVFLEQRRLGEAVEAFTRGKNMCEKMYGLENINTMMFVENLGIVYSEQGRLDEAEEALTRWVCFLEKETVDYGPEHPDTLSASTNLAVVYRKQRKLIEAEEIYNRVLQSQEKLHGVNDSQTMTTLSILGVLYGEQRRYDEAVEKLTLAMNFFKKADGIGLNHRITLSIESNLASVYRCQGKLDDAEEIYRRVLRRLEKIHVIDNPETMLTLYNLGSLLFIGGRLDEAEEAYTRVKTNLEKADGYGSEHPDTKDAAEKLSEIRNKKRQKASTKNVKKKNNGLYFLLTLAVLSGSIYIAWSFASQTKHSKKYWY